MIEKETPLGEIRGYYRSTLVAALTLFKKEVDATRKKEEGIGGETAHLDDKDEIIEQFRFCLGASTAESIADTPIGKAIAEGESKHQGNGKPPAEQIELAAGAQTSDPFAPSADVNIADAGVIRLMLELAGFAHGTVDAMSTGIDGGSIPTIDQWTQEQTLAVYRWTKAIQLSTIEGSNVTRSDIPPVPDVILPQSISDETLGRLHEGEQSRMRNLLHVRDAIEAGAINWPALLTELAIPDNSGQPWGPSAERILELVAAGPYVVVEDAFGFAVKLPTGDDEAVTLGGENTKYDRVGALTRCMLLNGREGFKAAGGEEPPAPPTSNDIAKAKKKRAARTPKK
jgi:hypothetical protein